MKRDLFIGQDGEQEIEVNLQAFDAEGVHSLCDSTIAYSDIVGGGWVHSTEYNGTILRVSVSAYPSYNIEGERKMENNEINNYWNDGLSSPELIDWYSDQYSQNVNSFPMSHYKQILPLFSCVTFITFFHILPLLP